MNKYGQRAIVLCIALVLTIVASGCSAPTAPTRSSPPLEPYPFSLSLDFSSQLPERIVPATAPIDAHRRYRVNDMLRSGLDERLRSRSSESATRHVTVSVELLALTFDYEEIGAVEHRPFPLLADLHGRVAAIDNDDGGGMEIPYETVKSATLRLRVDIAIDGAGTTSRELTENHVESVMHDDMRARWPDDFHSFDKVVTGVVAAAVDAVDALLGEQLAAGGGPGGRSGS